jgi:hypothetical protein
MTKADLERNLEANLRGLKTCGDDREKLCRTLSAIVSQVLRYLFDVAVEPVRK